MHQNGLFYNVNHIFLFLKIFSRYVSNEDYPYSLYPPYCEGAFYLMSFKIMENLIDLFEQEYHRNYLWIEDVYLTGMKNYTIKKLPFTIFKHFFRNFAFTGQYSIEEYTDKNLSKYSMDQVWFSITTGYNS